ncbi:MAG: hypothetical protein ACRCSQ_08225 [Bacteroidales bacterium]
MNPIIRNISRNRAAIPVGIIITMIMTTMTFLFLNRLLPSAQPDNSVWSFFESMKGNIHRGIILNYLLVIASGWVLFKINEGFSLSHYRSYLPFLFYLLLQITNPLIQFFSEGSIVAILAIPAIAVLFASYQNENGTEQGFWTGLLIGTLGLFWTRGLLYIPVFIIGLRIVRSWKFRTFLSLLFGIAVPFWLQFAWYFFRGEPDIFTNQFLSLRNFQIDAILRIPLSLQMHLGITIFLGMVGGTYLLITNFREKVRTQAYFNFLILLSLFSTALSIVDANNMSGHVTFVYLTIALLASNYFLKVQTKLTSFLFSLIIAAYSTSYVYCLWIN